MKYTNLNWRNGQPYSELYDDIYYSSDDAECIAGEQEFDHVFFSNNGLPERWSGSGDFVIAELGFGSGLNCMLTIRRWLEFTSGRETHACLHYIAVEKHPLSPAAITELISRYPQLKSYCDELLKSYPPAVEGTHTRHLFDGRVVLHYSFMDAYQALEDETLDVDAWYLDGFSPAKNEAMWSRELFEKISQNSHTDTTCSTYTAAGFVKRNMRDAGFEVRKVRGFGKKREMLAARIISPRMAANKFSDRPWFARPQKKRFAGTGICVIGAGIAGLSIAYALTRRGYDVTIIDAHDDSVKSASSNPAAIVYPRLSVDDDASMAFNNSAFCYALYQLAQLQDKSEQQFWFDCGLIQAIDKNRISRILEKFQFNDDYVSIHDIDDTGAVKMPIPGSSEQVFVAFRSAGVVLPPLLYDVLLEQCGEQLKIIDEEVDDVIRAGNSWQCYSKGRLLQESKILVVAGGTGINSLIKETDFPLDIVRGQAATLKQCGISGNIRHAVNAGVYITPAIGDVHYLGASYARDSNNMQTDDDDNRALLDGLNRLYPDVFSEQALTGSWVGFRTMSRDRAPLAGAVPDVGFFEAEYGDISAGKTNRSYLPAKHLDGLYVSAAHGSRGFTTGFICAELIASQIAGELAPVSKKVQDYLNPSRFIVNHLKRRR